MTPKTTDTNAQLGLLLGIGLHVLLFGVAQFVAFLIAATRLFGEQGIDPMWAQVTGVLYWLGSSLAVWVLWGRPRGAIAPLLAGVLGSMLLVSGNLGRNWSWFGSLPLHDVVQWTLVSPVPVLLAWLAWTDSRWRLVAVHIVMLAVLVAGLVVHFVRPDYLSVARLAFHL